MRRNPVPRSHSEASQKVSAVRRRLRVLAAKINRAPERVLVGLVREALDLMAEGLTHLTGRLQGHGDVFRHLSAEEREAANWLNQWASFPTMTMPNWLNSNAERKVWLHQIIERYLFHETQYRRRYLGEKPHLDEHYATKRRKRDRLTDTVFTWPRNLHADVEVERARHLHSALVSAYRHTLTLFPFVSWNKYRQKLLRLILQLRNTSPKSWPSVLQYEGWTLLPKLGIPARELVGPYTYMKPADYIREQQKPLGPVQLMVSYDVVAQSPNVSEFIAEVNHRGKHDLDRYDQALGAAVHAYVTTHGNQTPSIQTVLNINRQVERERELKGKAEAFETMQKWWEKITDAGLFHNIRLIQQALARHGGEWVVFDGSKEVMEELWYRVRTWGLCTIDQMIYWAEQSPSRWECYYLVLAADRKRGTVVGLNDSYICPHTSWATGVNNKLDPAAFEYFNSDRVWWWKHA